MYKIKIHKVNKMNNIYICRQTEEKGLSDARRKAGIALFFAFFSHIYCSDEK